MGPSNSKWKGSLKGHIVNINLPSQPAWGKLDPDSKNTQYGAQDYTNFSPRYASDTANPLSGTYKMKYPSQTDFLNSSELATTTNGEQMNATFDKVRSDSISSHQPNYQQQTTDINHHSQLSNNGTNQPTNSLNSIQGVEISNDFQRYYPSFNNQTGISAPVYHQPVSQQYMQY